MIALIASLLFSSACILSPVDPDPVRTGQAVNVIEWEPSNVTRGQNPDNREALYKQGVSFDEFLATAELRKERWHRNYKNSDVDDDLLVRALAVKGSWRLLAVAVDSCSDSVSTIPYLARLVSEVNGLEMRIIDSTVGRQIMMDHLTGDGREATPTVVLLNDAYEEVGCFVERPVLLREWISENRTGLNDGEYLKQKFAWYDEDAGRHTVEAIVTMMENAADGKTGC